MRQPQIVGVPAAGWALHASRRKFLRGTLLSGAGLCFSFVPELERASADPLGIARPTVAQQKQVGREAASEARKQYRELPESDGRCRHFRSIGERLVRALPPAERSAWDYSFHVLESKTVNAFAVPGGPMFMFTGLHEKLTTDDALAAVTGHELAHVRLQHWASAYARENRAKAAVGAGIILTAAPLKAALLAVLAQHAVNLKYSRGAEDQADQGGLQNLVAAGYNPSGMLELFSTLEKVQSSAGGAPPAWLSNHPDTAARFQATRRRIAAYGANRRWPPETTVNYATLKG